MHFLWAEQWSEVDRAIGDMRPRMPLDRIPNLLNILNRTARRRPGDGLADDPYWRRARMIPSWPTSMDC